jgi:cell division septation protein DedD
MSFEQDHRMPLASDHDLELDEEMRYEEPARRRFPGILIGFVIAALLMGGAFWWGYDLGRSGENSLFPPLIQADRAPIREAPAEPGGLQVPNQESLVFDGVSGEEDTADQVGVLSTPPEEPLARSDAQRTAQQDQDIEPSAAAIRVIDTDAGGVETEAVPPPPPPLAEEDLSATALRAGREATSGPIPQELDPKQQIAAVTPPAAPRVTTPKSAETETAPVVAPAPKVAPADAPPVLAAAGAFRVQIGSYRTEAGALSGWKILQTAHDSLLKDLKPTIVSADLGARGVFHRLQAGPLAGRAAADTLCTSLKVRKQGCLVVGP